MSVVSLLPLLLLLSASPSRTATKYWGETQTLFGANRKSWNGIVLVAWVVVVRAVVIFVLKQCAANKIVVIATPTIELIMPCPRSIVLLQFIILEIGVLYFSCVVCRLSRCLYAFYFTLSIRHLWLSDERTKQRSFLSSSSSNTEYRNNTSIKIDIFFSNRNERKIQSLILKTESSRISH